MLDSEAFPHILDAIIDFAPPASLVVLRACSRSVRDRADKHLFDHVQVVFPCYACNTDVSVSPPGSNLSFEWLRGPPGSPPIFGRRGDTLITLPRQMTGAPPRTPRAMLREYVSERIKATRVLDLSLPAYYSAGRSQEVLHDGLFHWSSGVLKPTTLRLFGTPKPDTCFSIRWAMSTQMRECVVFDDWRIDVGSLGHLGHTLFPDRPAVEMVGRRRASLYHLESSLGFGDAHTVAMHLCAPDSSRDHLRPRRPHATADTVRQILSFPFARKTPPCVTVVGGARACRLGLGLSPTASDADFYAALDDLAPHLPDARNWARLTKTAHDGLLAHWRQYLRFVLPSEYAGEVGPRQFALETQVDLDGPPAAYVP